MPRSRAFTESGFAAATVDDVRRRSGASVGSIYHHFGGKQELAEALYAGGASGLPARLPRGARARRRTPSRA